MAPLVIRKCVQKGDRVTSLYGDGDSLKQVLCLHHFICYSRYPLADEFDGLYVPCAFSFYNNWHKNVGVC